MSLRIWMLDRQKESFELKIVLSTYLRKKTNRNSFISQDYPKEFKTDYRKQTLNVCTRQVLPLKPKQCYRGRDLFFYLLEAKIKTNPDLLVQSRLLLLKDLLQTIEDGGGADVDAAVDERRDVRRRFLDVVKHRMVARVLDDAPVVERLLPEQKHPILTRNLKNKTQE